MKDILLEEPDKKKIKPKKEIIKINTIDNVQPSNNLDLHNPNYISGSNIYKNELPNLINLSPDLNVIDVKVIEKVKNSIDNEKIITKKIKINEEDIEIKNN